MKKADFKALKLAVIKNGNSKAVVIPKPTLELADIKNNRVDIKIELLNQWLNLNLPVVKIGTSKGVRIPQPILYMALRFGRKISIKIKLK